METATAGMETRALHPVSDVRVLATPRLDLVPATASLIRAEMEAPCLFFDMLGVHAIEDWPPADLAGALPFFREQLERHPNLAGWLSWYWVLRREDASQSAGCEDPPPPGVLIGSGGFKGRPKDGSVEIGYHVRAAHRRRGYATEALRALLTWAFARPELTHVIAETAADNAASIALLEKLGAALAQYAACCRALADELGVEPAAETTSLYQQIRAGELEPPPAARQM